MPHLDEARGLIKAATYFRVHLAVGVAAAVAAYKIIPFDTKDDDVGGIVNLATGQATLPAGKWLLYAKHMGQNGVPTQVAIFKNGASVAEGTYNSGDGVFTKQVVSDIVTSNGADVFDARGYHAAAGTFFGGTGELTYFYGVKIA
jgi:hypothetical protein